MDRENQLLIDFIENNNKRSLEELFKMTKPWLYRLILGVVINKDEADEVMQQTWIKVLGTANRFDASKGKFTNYLYTVAKSKSISWKKKSSRFVGQNQINNSQSSNHTEIMSNPYDDMEIAERNNLINKAIEKLDIDYKAVINLYYFEEMDIKEISKILNKPEGTIKTWLSRARMDLGQSLKKANFKSFLTMFYFLLNIFFILLLSRLEIIK